MKIDFHVHSFNDKVAEKAISKLESLIHYPALTRGTMSETKKAYREYGVEKFVLLPIATKPSQQRIINDWAFKQSDDQVIAFGSIHPEAEDLFEELERIKAMGMRGIKLHPDYQDFEIDEERMYPIYRKCAELNLIVVFHAGYDCLSPDHYHATTEMSARAHKAVPELTMVLAHLGSNFQWGQVYEELAGLEGNIYFDISYVANHIDEKLCYEIIKKHGADRILFASDFPWTSPIATADFIESMPLTHEEKELIFHGNAERLLGM
ncbi:MAG: amidohydrolase family protein [Clostridiales bacterium]|nr:amidohydrolase family protein [Clostridiales bacterium]